MSPQPIRRGLLVPPPVCVERGHADTVRVGGGEGGGDVGGVQGAEGRRWLGNGHTGAARGTDRGGVKVNTVVIYIYIILISPIK